MSESEQVSIKRGTVPASTGGTPSTFTSTSDAAIQAANTARVGLTIMNEGAGTLYVLLGDGVASATNYSVKLVSGAYYEVPSRYTGQIRGIFGSAGTARIQELT